MQKLCKERGLAANGPKEVIHNRLIRLIEDISSIMSTSGAKIQNHVASDPNSNIDVSEVAQPWTTNTVKEEIKHEQVKYF